MRSVIATSVMTPPETALKKQKVPTVILIHGILRDGRCMRKIARRIEDTSGLPTLSVTYKTRNKSLVQAAEGIAEDVRSTVSAGMPVFAVACSLGTVVLRHMMALPDRGGIDWAGCVLIAPPSQGSMVARSIGRLPLIKWLVGLVLGKGGRELYSAAADGKQWADPPQPCAVIAGTKNLTLLNPVGWVSNLFRIIAVPNDGTIAVQETRLPPGLTSEFHLVYAGHTQIQNNERVMQLACDFINSQDFRTNQSFD